ncbi:hypothetical protein CANCADRAFT_32521 [Tortispora caseinolytica NRRL Y-17796]|uniref:Zn(2)-C6 fungal-type domain-containing protein n=1 Tax=Tortispora caseinolytica NRRL Y-17796 TaxID=767744 RepID=A0A1E4TBQ7_9ASCO|nr:hypothetical protein CANCADRAFT_32521 [Tortispora caseinolytica NRRL Y-17796]
MSSTSSMTIPAIAPLVQDPSIQSESIKDVNNSMPRRRSKVSRACDKCRRKKIRCDIVPNSDVPCTSCQRAGEKCAFSRIPLKRGPSKGYIKELEVRLNTLESTLSEGSPTPHPPVEHNIETASDHTNAPPQPRRSSLFAILSAPVPYNQQSLPSPSTNYYSHESSASPSSQTTTFSSATSTALESRVLPKPISQKFNPSVHIDKPPSPPTRSWFPPDTLRNSPPDTSMAYRLAGDPRSPESQKQYLIAPMQPPIMTSPILPVPSVNANAVGTMGAFTDVTTIPDALYDDYYALIHPTFPILLHSRAQQKRRMEHNEDSGLLSSLMYWALVLAIQSFPKAASGVNYANTFQSNNVPTGQQLRAVCLSILAQVHLKNYCIVVQMQILLLLTIGCDNVTFDVEMNQDQNSIQNSVRQGIPADVEAVEALRAAKGALIGAATGIALSSRLYEARSTTGVKRESNMGKDNNEFQTNVRPINGSSSSRGAYQEDEDNETLTRRLFLLLVTLDRWNMIESGSPCMIQESHVVLTPSDESIMGYTPYKLLKLSLVVGHIGDAIQQHTVKRLSGDGCADGCGYQHNDTTSHMVLKMLKSEIQQYQESIEPLWGCHTVLTMGLWFSEILLFVLSAGSVNGKGWTPSFPGPEGCLRLAIRIASLLESPSTPATPFSHHFASVAVIMLSSLSHEPSLKEEALRGLQGLLGDSGMDANEQNLSSRCSMASSPWSSRLKELSKRIVNSQRPVVSSYRGANPLDDLATVAMQHVSPDSYSDLDISSKYLLCTREGGYLQAWRASI